MLQREVEARPFHPNHKFCVDTQFQNKICSMCLQRCVLLSTNWKFLILVIKNLLYQWPWIYTAHCDDPLTYCKARRNCCLRSASHSSNNMSWKSIYLDQRYLFFWHQHYLQRIKLLQQYNRDGLTTNQCKTVFYYMHGWRVNSILRIFNVITSSFQCVGHMLIAPLVKVAHPLRPLYILK